MRRRDEPTWMERVIALFDTLAAIGIHTQVDLDARIKQIEESREVGK